MAGSSGMHGGGSSAGSGGLNGVKLEGPGYYCNSYTPPAPVDHGLLSTTYSKFHLKNKHESLATSNHI